MNEERRGSPRVNTHIAMEINVSGDQKLHFGYIENLSEGGMGVASLDYLMPGTQISSRFNLPRLGEKVRPIASVMHVVQGSDMIYYYGLRFDYVRETDRSALNEFLKERKLVAV